MHTATQMQDRTVRHYDGGEDGILSASYRPTEPVISELEIHKGFQLQASPMELYRHRITA